ncbi:MAG TPA: CsgG/HfaB family protein [Syntrophales bacterium]|nr:CsgG/HfaB family protein [Syntrophales bacterium]
MRKALLYAMVLSLSLLLGCAGMPGTGGGDKAEDKGLDNLPPYTGPKIGVAVMDFETKVPGHGWRVGYGASDMLTTALVKCKKFRVYERDKLASIMKEQGLQLSGAVDGATAVRVGKLIGVKYIVTGAVTEYGTSKSGFNLPGYFAMGKTGYAAAVDIRIVSVETGEIIFADTGSGALESQSMAVLGIGGGESFDQKKASQAMRIAIDDLARKMYFELK